MCCRRSTIWSIRVSGARVDDPAWRQALDGADRLPVVSELPVVVVLDDQTCGVAGPVGEPGPARRIERRAGRVLMCRGDHDGR